MTICIRAVRGHSTCVNECSAMHGQRNARPALTFPIAKRHHLWPDRAKQTVRRHNRLADCRARQCSAWESNPGPDWWLATLLATTLTNHAHIVVQCRTDTSSSVINYWNRKQHTLTDEFCITKRNNNLCVGRRSRWTCNAKILSVRWYCQCRFTHGIHRSWSVPVSYLVYLFI